MPTLSCLAGITKLIFAFFVCIHPLHASPVAIPHENAVGTVWRFPNETWIENLAVRQNGEILCSSIDRAAIYLVNPFEHSATTLHQFDATYGVLGIADVQNDIFVVNTAEIDLKTSMGVPGTAKIWKVDVGAWALVCIDNGIKTCLLSLR